MPDKNRSEDTEYIIDRIRNREKKRAENKVEKRKSGGRDSKDGFSVNKQDSSGGNEEIPDMELGCYFFFILPFIASILFLIILIALLR
ncbi:hypothetical protein [Lacicoccus alkaliphilus]|nr:hypothetical protein [Salinicoccus alkaliphilus]